MTSPMLVHSMGVLRLYKILSKVQKHLGGVGHAQSAYALSLWTGIAILRRSISKPILAPDLRQRYHQRR